MPDPDPSKPEKSSFEEAVDQVTRLASHIADAIDSESTNPEDSFDEFDELESEIKEADKADQKRRDALEAKRERIREEFAKKWKRY